MDTRRIGVVGLGSMGSGMAARLLEKGYDVTVHNRTRAKAEPLERLGARVAASPADLAKDADVVIVSLADGAAAESALFGQEGVVGRLRRGVLIANTSTVSPGQARDLDRRAALEGHRVLDACVLGNAAHARAGDLRFMVGGEAADLGRLAEVLDALGKEVSHLGPCGLGATMKLVLNLIMGIQMQSLAEAAVFGERAGLPREAVLRAVASSGFSSPVMRFKAGVMRERAFERADFRLSLMRKDLTLALSECRDLSVPMPVTEAAQQVLTSAANLGLGDRDCSAVLVLMERLAALGDGPGLLTDS